MTVTKQEGKISIVYYIHIVVFILITFGFGYLPPFAQISEVGMRVLGAFLGAVYGWLFIALDWPSLIALLALGISGYADSFQDLFIAGWTFNSVSQSLLGYCLAEALAATKFTSYVANKLMKLRIFRGKPYALMFGCLIASEIMFALHCGLAGLFLLWSMYSTIAEKAGYEKRNKFTMIMVPSTVMSFMLANFLWPFNPGSIVQINFFANGMAAYDSNATVPFIGWTVWWLLFTNIYLALWLVVVKYGLRLRFPEIAVLGEELAAMGGKDEKMTFEQKYALGVLIGFLLGMFLPNIAPAEWVLTKICSMLGLTGMLCLALCILCAYRKANGEEFITFQSISKGIVWNIIWLLVATEPLANAFNAEQCGIMASIMAVVTPILHSMGSTVFLIAALIILGLVTQVVHNFVLMVVFIPLLCPMYAQMGGNPFIMFFGLIVVLNSALTTPAASYLSALMFGSGTMETKDCYIQGFVHFVFALLLFFIIGAPLVNLLMPY